MSPVWPSEHVCCTAQVHSRWPEPDVFIRRTSGQLRDSCSLDTPHLFIIVPLAMTLPFYFSMLIHLLLISTAMDHHTSRLTARGLVPLGGREAV